MAKILNIDGITLLYEKNKLNKGTYCVFGIKTGAFAEKIWGTAHFLEHMLFYKTKNRTTEEVKEAEDKLDIGAYTGFDYMCIHFGVSSRLAEESFDVCSDMFFNCAFDDEDMNKERGPILQEINRTSDNKKRMAKLAHLSKIFDEPRLAISAVGTVEDVKKLKEKDLREYQKENYCKENFVVSVCSNLSVEKIEQLVKKYIVPHLKSNKHFVAKRRCDETKILHNNFLQIIKTEQDECSVLLTINTSRNSYEEYVKRACASDIMFFVKGKLYKTLREKYGLIYASPGQATWFTKDNTVKYMVQLCSKESIKKVIKYSVEVFADVVKNGISVEDFEKWKEISQNEYDVSLQHPEGIADDMIDFYLDCNFVKTLKQIFDAKMKITREELNSFIKQYFKLDNLQLTVSGKVEQNDVPTEKEFFKMVDDAYNKKVSKKVEKSTK